MRNRNRISEDYFEWICRTIHHAKRFTNPYSFNKLLRYLHDVEFTYSIPKDSNRAADGISLRYRFAYDTGCACADSYLEGPCSVLEMMVALSFAIEEVMDDALMGDRTSQWFWGMITNLGLGSMMDNNYDARYVEETVRRFLDRDYAFDGRGGLFTVRRCERDLRDVEIWIQACWFLDTIT